MSSDAAPAAAAAAAAAAPAAAAAAAASATLKKKEEEETFDWLELRHALDHDKDGLRHMDHTTDKEKFIKLFKQNPFIPVGKLQGSRLLLSPQLICVPLPPFLFCLFILQVP